MNQKIGIIGSGDVGKTLAKGFQKHGCQVMLGTHTPDKIAELQKEFGNDIQVGTFQDTAQFGELLVLTVKGSVAVDVAKNLAEHMKGKTVIDTTNPIANMPPQNGVLAYFTDFTESLLEKIQLAAPYAHCVKAFNSVGNALMVNPDFGGVKPTMFICGNDANAKKEVSEILNVFGWEVEDMGGAEAARAIEPLCMLWCIPGMLRNEWTNHAFKLLKK